MTELVGLERDDTLVCVRAQVMTCDNNLGGWVPYGEGGYSDVSLIRLYHSDTDKLKRVEYVIIGKHTTDQSVILHCMLKRDIAYRYVNPVFIHWNIQEARYGLTFERASDANSFHNSMKMAVSHLTHGLFVIPEDGEQDDVFMAIDLPLGRKDSSSKSASTTSTTASSPTTLSPIHSVPSSHDIPANDEHLHRIQFTPRSLTPQQHVPLIDKSSVIKIDNSDMPCSHCRDESQTDECESAMVTISKGSSRDYPYVVCYKDQDSTSRHAYSYPQMDPIQKADEPIKIQPSSGVPSPVPLPTKVRKTNSRKYDKQTSLRAQCKYCSKYFIRGDNHRGSCDSAPDRLTKCIEYTSCMCVAKGVIYHCVSDSEGDYGHLCSCDSEDELNCRRWSVLGVLSLFVPCLLCYLPLKKCHECSIHCGLCGGRHKAL